MGKIKIFVNTDGQVVVTEHFISEEVLIALDRAASLKLARDILRAQGHDCARGEFARPCPLGTM